MSAHSQVQIQNIITSYLEAPPPQEESSIKKKKSLKQYITLILNKLLGFVTYTKH